MTIRRVFAIVAAVVAAHALLTAAPVAAQCTDCTSDCTSGCTTDAACCDSGSCCGGSKGCGSGCGGCDCYCSEVCGWFAGIELVYVKPHFEDETEFDLDNRELPRDEVRFDYEASPRFYLGYRHCDGLGLRLRYWTFDADASGVVFSPGGDDPDFETSSLEIDAVDIEATQLVCWGPLEADFSAGGRWAELEQSQLDFWDGTPGGRPDEFGTNSFDGFGPTLALEGRRRCGSGLALVGNARGSFLYGETRRFLDRDDGLDQNDVLEGDLVMVLESQVGVEWSHCTDHGRVALRAMLEGQWWGSAGGDSDYLIDGDETSTLQDVGLFGGSFGLVYNY